jgi:rhamnosyl/mannosyltransferase
MLGISERVHFVGQISAFEKKQLIAAADAFVFPSTETTEAFGISQLEAMAIGTPVVSSDLPSGVTDIAVHDETALVTTPGDAASLAQAILLLLHDRDLCTRLTLGAQKHLYASYTKADILARTRSLLERLLESELGRMPGRKARLNGRATEIR